MTFVSNFDEVTINVALIKTRIRQYREKKGEKQNVNV